MVRVNKFLACVFTLLIFSGAFSQEEGDFYPSGDGTVSLAFRVGLNGEFVSEAAYRVPLLPLGDLSLYNVTSARAEGSLQGDFGVGVLTGFGVDYFTPTVGWSLEARLRTTYTEGEIDVNPEILGAYTFPFSLF